MMRPSESPIPHGVRVVVDPGADDEGDDGAARGESARADLAPFDAIYDENVAFLHRGAARLGIEDGAIDDVLQEVFLIAYRRLADFRHEASLRTWLYGILLRVVRHHRRSIVRSGLHGVIDRSASEHVTEHVADVQSLAPDVAAETADAWRTLMRVLDQLDDDKREIFVLAELEQLPIPEISDLLGLKLNTAYSRLRLARAAFESALDRVTRNR